MELVQTHVVADTPVYYAELDEYKGQNDEQMLFFHIRLKEEVSKEVIKLLKRDWKVFRENVTVPLFAYNDQEDPLWHHFVRIFNFKFMSKIKDEQGIERSIYYHVKEPLNARQADHPKHPEGIVGSVGSSTAVHAGRIPTGAESIQ